MPAAFQRAGAFDLLCCEAGGRTGQASEPAVEQRRIGHLYLHLAIALAAAELAFGVGASARQAQRQFAAGVVVVGLNAELPIQLCVIRLQRQAVDLQQRCFPHAVGSKPLHAHALAACGLRIARDHTCHLSFECNACVTLLRRELAVHHGVGQARIHRRGIHAHQLRLALPAS